jgi:pilus assembly protein CpaC
MPKITWPWPVTLRFAVLCFAFGEVLAPDHAAAQMQVPAMANAPLAVSVHRAGGLTVRGNEPAARTLHLAVGKSMMLESPADISDVMIANPEIADAVVRSQRQLYLVGIGQGETNVLLIGRGNRVLLSINVRVSKDLAELQTALHDLIPSSQIRAHPMADSIVLVGSAGTPADATHAVMLAERFAGKSERVINMLSVKGKEQVLLTVTVAEVNRSSLTRFGIRWRDLAAKAGAIAAQGDIANAFALTSGVVSPAASGSAAGSGATLLASLTGNGFGASALLEALERSGSLHILAEPNLTAISGETANFLAGGEIPVPVARDGNQVAIEWKQFGVALAFTPVVLSVGRISLKISTEVSELSAEGAVQSGGLSIPSINVRRVTSSVELPSGGAIVLAGLLSEQMRRSADTIPGLGKLPVLGRLFESADFTHSQTELMVIVAPYLADARPRTAFLPQSSLLSAESAWAGKNEPAAHAPSRRMAAPRNGFNGEH